MTQPAARVLIVDDNRDAADSLATLVRLWGHTVDVAYDGATGFRAAVETRPDCLLLDIHMPGQDGYSVARRVRETPGLERTKLVAVSAFSHDDHVRRAKAAGFDRLLTKPADPDALRELLDMLKTITDLAEKTEALARQNVALAGQTKELLQEVKEDIREVKQDIRELKEELREVRENRDESDPPGR